METALNSSIATAFPVEHSRQEDAHRLGDREDQPEEDRDLKPSIRRHQNFSGRNSA
jgi:hypothetical protein